MHLFSHPFLQTSQITLNVHVASGWASNLAQEACLGYGVVGDPPTRVTAWGRFSPPAPERAPSGSSRPRNPDAERRRGHLAHISPTGERRGAGVEGGQHRTALGVIATRATAGSRSTTCPKGGWKPAQNGGAARLDRRERNCRRTPTGPPEPVSGPSEPETGPRRAPGREWAGPLSRKCLRSWPGARPRGLGGLAALRGGGTEPGSRPRSRVSVRLGEGGTL